MYDLMPDPTTNVCEELLGRPRYLIPDMHARAWVRWGMFYDRPPLDRIMGVIANHERRIDTQISAANFTTQDPRMRGADQLYDLTRIQLLVAGLDLGEHDQFWVTPSVFEPQSALYNWDYAGRLLEVGRGMPAELLVLKGRKVVPNEVQSAFVQKMDDNYDVDASTVGNTEGRAISMEPHYVVSATIGPEAVRAMGHSWAFT